MRNRKETNFFCWFLSCWSWYIYHTKNISGILLYCLLSWLYCVALYLILVCFPSRSFHHNFIFCSCYVLFSFSLYSFLRIYRAMDKDIYLINQARGPYWENIGPGSWQYGPSAARSVQKRPRVDILPVRSRASLVNKRFITRLKPCSKDTSVGSFGTIPGPILREYWTGNRAFWLVDFSYWPSDCLSRVIITFIAWKWQLTVISLKWCWLCHCGR